ncbi:hypothetical protein C5167_000132 [Papaver somniferum]|uniref:Uncharacterized protein n=1 Tax=Papaver somniferum TaxID=3469 RepID=A0A4Y7KTW7_PAPSO|nr:hypothetical protein C5167_000132 [Papaver somniferum]
MSKMTKILAETDDREESSYNHMKTVAVLDPAIHSNKADVDGDGGDSGGQRSLKMLRILLRKRRR